MNELPRSMREELEAAMEQDPDDNFDMLITACVDELKSQRVEQVQTRRKKTRKG